jgi:hypothetical protein
MGTEFYSLHMLCASCVWFDFTGGWHLLDAIADENNA